MRERAPRAGPGTIASRHHIEIAVPGRRGPLNIADRRDAALSPAVSGHKLPASQRLSPSPPSRESVKSRARVDEVKKAPCKARQRDLEAVVRSKAARRGHELPRTTRRARARGCGVLGRSPVLAADF